MARRAPGTGTRVLLDRLLLDADLDPDALRGPEVGSHLEVALAVAAEIVDAGLGARSAAAALDLRFVPITWEDYDLVLPEDALDPAAPLITAVRSSAMRAAVEALGGYDTARSARWSTWTRLAEPWPARSSGSGRPSASHHGRRW